jgi:hypothetical protein
MLRNGVAPVASWGAVAVALRVLALELLALGVGALAGAASTPRWPPLHLGAFVLAALAGGAYAGARSTGRARALLSFVLPTAGLLTLERAVRLLDSDGVRVAVLGSRVPRPFENVLFFVTAVAAIGGGCLLLLVATTRRRWLVCAVATIQLLLLGAAVWFGTRLGALIFPPNGAWLDVLADLEAKPGTGQVAAEVLAILGEDGRARDVHRHATPGMPSGPVSGAIAPPRPWRETLAQIAAKNRLVLLMEGHHLSEHRELIRRALPLFERAGFRTYAAEALMDSAASLAKRGRPSSEFDGYYVGDPRFAGILRDASALGFGIVPYEACCRWEAREEGQAATLAAILARGEKLLVHAGWGHVDKSGGRRGPMAARLWHKSGVEPVSVYQLSSGMSGRDGIVYARLSATLVFTEPVLFAPAPSELGGVDAVVVHPPLGIDEPDARPRWLRADDRRRLKVHVHGGARPLLLAALLEGEPEWAVPADQVVLRDGDAAELWVPRAPVRLRAWTRDREVALVVRETEAGFDVDAR